MTGEYSSEDFRTRFSKQARRAAETSDLIIAVSEFTRGQVEACLNAPAERIRVVPHGVHLVNSPPALSTRERMILCVGALQVRKNVTRLVEAFESVSPVIRSDWKLVLAGSTAGYGAARILARIEQSRVASQIQLRGYVSDSELDELYSRATLFAFPSLDEGFGIPVLEAMAHAVPVLTSNCSALPQVAGDAAVLVDPQDSSEIAHALESLMSNEQLRSELVERGRQRAALFPWEHTIQATYDVYRELAG
jgi:glycosyltransferase involved in cell wall biosynthesis